MDRQDFTEFITEVFQDEILGLNSTKGSDYSGTEDAFRNFKEGAARLGLHPHQVWAVYCSKHMDAIWTFVKDGGVVKSEPIEGRIDDAILYLFLLRGMVRESAFHSSDEHELVSPVQESGDGVDTPKHRDSVEGIPAPDGEIWTREDLLSTGPLQMTYIPMDIRKALPACNCDEHNEFHSAACPFAIYLSSMGRSSGDPAGKPQPYPRT